MIAAVALYFVLATAVLAVLLLPNLRAQAIGWVQRMRAAGVSVRSAVGSGSGGRRPDPAVDRAWLAVALGAGAVVLVGAPLVALSLRGFLELEGYDHRVSREVSDQVRVLLAGERLAPPPPLPPELFTVPEVERFYPLIATADRKWELLDGEFSRRLLVVYKVMRERHGYEMVLLEGYRSPERQAELVAKGPQVTRAGAFESWHQYGLAADSAFRRAGRLVIDEKDPWAARGYELYGQVAAEAGLVWGGAWKSIKDLGHVELPRDGARTRPAGDAEPAVRHQR